MWQRSTAVTRPYEINASDDRTAASLVTRIQVSWVLKWMHAWHRRLCYVHQSTNNVPDCSSQ